MNPADPFKQLMERRLWPVALLLVAALVAVPVLLKSDSSGSTAPAPLAVAAGPTGPAPDDTVVGPADESRTDQVRSVLGDRKDPFRPAQVDTVPKDETADTDGGGAGSLADALKQAVAETGGGAPGGTTTGGTTGGETAGPTGPVAPKVPEYELYSLMVRFGSIDGELESRVIERKTGLPNGTPALMYLGLLPDHKTAVFLVDAGVTVEGDGKCDPSPEDCQTLTLKEGETEFFTRNDKTFQLDLHKIVTKKTTDKEKLEQARRETAAGGEQTDQQVDALNPYAYSARTGTLRRTASARASGPAGAFDGILDAGE